MQYRFMNFVRNTMAFDYYKECAKRGINSADKSKYPNLYNLGKELCEMEGHNKRKSSLQNSVLLKTGLEGFVEKVQQEADREGSVVIRIDSLKVPKSDGEVGVTRRYFVSGEIFSEYCTFQTKEEADREELPIAIKNLVMLFPRYNISSNEGNTIILKKKK